MDPELLVLDEPMAGLDHGMRKELLAVLDELNGRGITLLLATHDIDFAYRWADRIHLMTGGRCVASLDAAKLADDGHALSAVGLPLPAVVELQRALGAHGLLSDSALPRSHSELLAMLDGPTSQSH